MRYYNVKDQSGIFMYRKNGHRFYEFRFNYHDANGKRHEKSGRGFRSPAKAQAAKRYYRKHVKEYRKHPSITFGKWCQIFLKDVKATNKISTYYSYFNLLNKHVIPVIGNMPIKKISRTDYKFRCLTPMLNQGLSRRTVMVVNARVQTVMNAARGNNYLKHNQLAHVKIPQHNFRKKKVIMTDSQLTKFNKVLNQEPLRVQAMYYTLEDTGIRAGELRGLKWKDIDFSHGTMAIRRTRDEYGIRSPKTKQSRRSLIIPHQLLNLLRKYKETCQKKFNISDNSLVIRGKFGKPLIPKYVSTVLKRLLILAGMKHIIGRFTPHSFRHMFASRLISHGADINAVSKMLGHANTNITLSIYSQSAPSKHSNINKYFQKYWE